MMQAPTAAPAHQPPDAPPPPKLPPPPLLLDRELDELDELELDRELELLLARVAFVLPRPLRPAPATLAPKIKASGLTGFRRNGLP